MKVEIGNFEIPVGKQRNRYAKPFSEFKKNDAPMLKYTFDNNREAMSCTHSLIALIKHEEGDRFRVIKRKLEVFVLRRDDRADKELEG